MNLFNPFNKKNARFTLIYAYLERKSNWIFR